MQTYEKKRRTVPEPRRQNGFWLLVAGFFIAALSFSMMTGNPEQGAAKIPSPTPSKTHRAPTPGGDWESYDPDDHVIDMLSRHVITVEQAKEMLQK